MLTALKECDAGGQIESPISAVYVQLGLHMYGGDEQFS